MGSDESSLLSIKKENVLMFGLDNSRINEIFHLISWGKINASSSENTYRMQKSIENKKIITKLTTEKNNKEEYKNKFSKEENLYLINKSSSFGIYTWNLWYINKKNELRSLWPFLYKKIFYQYIFFSINFEEKDTLNKSVRAMIDLLTREEFSESFIIIFLIKYSEKDNDNNEKDIKKYPSENKYSNQDELKKMEVIKTIEMENILQKIYFWKLPQLKKAFCLIKKYPNDVISNKDEFLWYPFSLKESINNENDLESGIKNVILSFS